MKKRVLAGLLISVFAVSALAGCGGSSSAPKTTEAAAADAEVITVAASATPHAEILEQAKTDSKDSTESSQKIIADSKAKAALLLETTRETCDKQIAETKLKTDKMVEDARAQSKAYWEEVRVKMEQMVSEHNDLKGLLQGILSKADD